MMEIEHLTDNQLNAYFGDSALERNAKHEIGRHLLQCDDCLKRLPQPKTEHFWTALLHGEPEPEKSFGGENLASAQSPFSRVFTFWRPPAALGACALILIAAFSFLIWLNASKQTTSEPQVAQRGEAFISGEPSYTRKDIPAVENSSLSAPGDKVQTIDNQGNSRPEWRLLSGKSKGNRSNTTEAASGPVETVEREVARLLENTPPAVSSLRPSGSIVRRGDKDKEKSNSTAPTFALVAPVGETVLETTPKFSWKKAEGATSYRISILDADFNEVAMAEVSGNSFTPGKPLKRGAKYLWRVAAQTPDGEIIAPRLPQPPAVFRVAPKNIENQVEFIKKQKGGELKLALIYAREGLLNPARCTLQRILMKTPEKARIRRLLTEVERWQKENSTAVRRCGAESLPAEDWEEANRERD